MSDILLVGTVVGQSVVHHAIPVNFRFYPLYGDVTIHNLPRGARVEGLVEFQGVPTLKVSANWEGMDVPYARRFISDTTPGRPRPAGAADIGSITIGAFTYYVYEDTIYVIP